MTPVTRTTTFRCLGCGKEEAQSETIDDPFLLGTPMPDPAGWYRSNLWLQMSDGGVFVSYAPVFCGTACALAFYTKHKGADNPIDSFMRGLEALAREHFGKAT